MEMRRVIIIGAGGHAAEIDEYINYSQEKSGIRELDLVGFLDDEPDNYYKYKFSAPFLGGVLDHSINCCYYYLIGIANIKYRSKVVTRFISEGARFTSFIHCNAYVSRSAVVGEGTIIGPNVNIGPNVRVGKFSLINSRASIGHDSIIGDFNIISPNVCFSGFTEIGNENLFGINSATIPEIKVGNLNKIASGMILHTNVGNDSVVFYRYKERIIALNKYDLNN